MALRREAKGVHAYRNRGFRPVLRHSAIIAAGRAALLCPIDQFDHARTLVARTCRPDILRRGLLLDWVLSRRSQRPRLAGT